MSNGLFWLLIKRIAVEYNRLSRSVLVHWLLTYLLFGVTMAAHGPKIFQSSPQEDNEETPEESNHGGGEKSPPHPLSVAVTGNIWGKRDDYVHLGNVDRGIRVEFIPIFRHFFVPQFLGGCQPSPTRNQVSWDTGARGSSGQRPLMPYRPLFCRLIWLLYRAVKS